VFRVGYVAAGSCTWATHRTAPGALESEALTLAHDVERGATIGVVVGASILRPADRLADVTADIARLRARLAELLADGE
jgi:hypothetical protein